MRNLDTHRFYDNTPPYRLGYLCCEKRRPQCTPRSRSASSGISCVHQLEEVDTFKFDTDNTFIDGIDPHMISMFDLHVPDSAPTHHDDLGDHRVKAISTASVGLRTPTGLGLRSSRRGLAYQR
jgi:hypothetical protein